MSRLQILFDDSIIRHFAAIERKEHSFILESIEQQLLVHNPRFVQLLEEARQRVHGTGGIPLDELRRRLDAAKEDQAPF